MTKDENGKNSDANYQIKKESMSKVELMQIMRVMRVVSMVRLLSMMRMMNMMSLLQTKVRGWDMGSK